MKSILRRGWLLAAIAFFSGLGCVHLHNAADSRQAAAAVQQFQAFQTNAGGVYGVMLANHQKAELAMSARLTAAVDQDFQARAGGVTSKTWGRIQDELATVMEALPGASNAVTSEFTRFVGQITGARAALKSDTEAAAALEAEREAAETTALQWQARWIFFRGALETFTSAGGTALLDRRSLDQARREIERRPVGNSTVGEILKSDLANLEKLRVAGLPNAYTLDLFDPAAAPGLKVQLLGLGEDLARAGIARTKITIDYLNAVTNLFSNWKQALGLQAKHLRLAQNPLRSLLTADPALAEIRVLATLEHFRSQSRQTQLEVCGQVLEWYSVAVSLDRAAIDELSRRPASLEHEHSIRISRINASEREALLARGLQSLERYHSGGITPEQIANLLQAAEAAGLGVIGARLH